MMQILNSLLSRITSFVLSPLAEWPLTALVLVSVLAGILMAVLFRYTSSQRRLRRVADLIRAQVLAIKLFQDDLGTMFGCLGRLLGYTGLRLILSLPPMLVMLVPFVLVLTQLATWYEHQPLAPGETAAVRLDVSPDNWQQLSDPALDAPDEIIVDAKPLRDAADRTIYWRIHGSEATQGTIGWNLDSERVEKQIVISDRPQRLCAVSVRRPGQGWWDQVLHPVEPPLEADSAARSVEVSFPTRSTPLFGWDVPWWGTFLIVSIAAAMAVGRWWGVQY